MTEALPKDHDRASELRELLLEMELLLARLDDLAVFDAGAHLAMAMEATERRIAKAAQGSRWAVVPGRLD